MFTRQIINISKRLTTRFKGCSSPVKMFSFMFLCMIIIFGFEYAGLVNREKNLEFRQSFIKGISVNHVFKTEGLETKPKTLEFQVKDVLNVIQKEKEDKKELMLNMLVMSAGFNTNIVDDSEKSIELKELPSVNNFFE